jgi:hypothetical protein
VSWQLQVGNAIWLIPDSLVLIQIYLYGKNEQHHPWLRKHFRLIVTLTLVACVYGLREFMWYTGDVYGVLTSWIMDIMLSALMLNMFFNRPKMQGVSYAATWLKLGGNIGGALFCYLWWPAQFVNGTLTTYFGGKPVTIREPTPPHTMLYFLYLTVPVLDILLIYLVWKKRREQITLPAEAEVLTAR